MTKKIVKTGIGVALALVLTNCGQSPFGAGSAGGLSLFAKIGKAMGKPSAINDETNKQEHAKSMVAEGQSAAKRLVAKSTGISQNWIVAQGIEQLGDDSLKYWEEVANKPSEEDADKLVTGRGEVVFRYTGTYTGSEEINGNLITAVYSWSFKGREYKTWKDELCSLVAVIDFGGSSLQNPLPGKTSLRGYNISSSKERGLGDTVYMFVDSLDTVNSSQFGGGTFFDAYTGSDNNGPSATFSFNLEVLHKDTYTNWSDNEGIMTFKYPWGNAGDSLFFKIHFYPNYERVGEIRKNSENGPVLVEFTNNDKTGNGTVKYYDENGNVIDND